MLRPVLDLICCPHCQQTLTLEEAQGDGEIESGRLGCDRCAKQYPIRAGIPRFASRRELQGRNKSAFWMENFNAHVYSLIVKAMLSYFGVSEETARQEYFQRLELEEHARILEVSVGTGANIPHCLTYGPGSEFFGLDLSPAMLAQCAKKSRAWGRKIQLFQGLGEMLPFRDETFDVVFHVGGINAFADKGRAISEMIRVARPGTKIIIVDEWLYLPYVKRFYERWFLRLFPGFARNTYPPIDLVPSHMQEINLETIWEKYGYCLEFRKPAQPVLG